MSRIRAYLDALEDPAHPGLQGPRHPHDNLLLSVVAATVAADGEIADDELEVMRKLAPDFNDDQLNMFIERVARDGLDYATIARAFSSEEERDDLVELVERMVWADGLVHQGERAMLMKLISTLEE